MHYRAMTYTAFPKNAGPATPSVVLAMHIWGVDENMRACARRFADAGFATVVPDIYEGMGAPNGDGETDHKRFLPFAQKLTFEVVDPAIRAGAQLLRERFPQTRTAIAGFCMGGVMALRRSYGYSDIFSAAAVWYGGLNAVDGSNVDIPIVASFGADDTGIPLEAVQTFEQALHVPHDVKVYPGAGHAFCDETRSSYEPRACEDSWTRALAFLRKHL